MNTKRGSERPSTRSLDSNVRNLGMPSSWHQSINRYNDNRSRCIKIHFEGGLSIRVSNNGGGGGGGGGDLYRNVVASHECGCLASVLLDID